MPGIHARFGPSKAARIIDCPASLLEDEKHTDPSGYDAAWGTACHTISERVLTQGGVAWLYRGDTIEVDGFKIEVDAEMVETANRYVSLCLITAGDHFVETRVDISRWCPVPDQFGTADFAACRPGLLNIKDLKGGKGVKVFAEWNPQAILYALGFIEAWNWLYDFKKVVIEIVQPRLDHYDEWETTVDELLAFGEYIRERFALALQPDPPFGPSEKACKFCRAAATCKPLRDHLNSTAALAFDDLDGFAVTDTNTLSIEDLVQAWRVAGLMESRLKAVRMSLMQRLAHGEAVPGLKLVEGKTHRRWKSSEEALKLLTGKFGLEPDVAAPRKIISPAQAEKRFPPSLRDQIAACAMKPPGKPAIAEEGDKRARYQIESLEAFGNLDEGVLVDSTES